MENKDLVWRDYKIKWPLCSKIYYDSLTHTDDLKLLKEILHADDIELKVIDNSLPYKIIYDNLRKKLLISNCSVDITYKNIDKLKVKGLYNE